MKAITWALAITAVGMMLAGIARDDFLWAVLSLFPTTALVGILAFLLSRGSPE